MDRKDFILKGLMGTGVFVAGATGLHALGNNIDELRPLDPQTAPDQLGFNHLPHTQSAVNANAVLHKAGTRGNANHGWLNSYHTFSFANYYNPERMHFGALRVLNDDTVEQGKGFPRHPHDNMEIISIPLEGDLEHKDSMGNVAVIKHGDVQVMSAGTGIQHSEYNKNRDRQVKFLQIWVFPNKKSVTPRYGQLTLNVKERHNRLQQILSPDANDEGVWIHQDAWFHLGRFDKNVKTAYSLKKKGNGVYAFVIKGDFDVNGYALQTRDGLGLWDISQLTVKSLSADAEILLMEVPMVI